MSSPSSLSMSDSSDDILSSLLSLSSLVGGVRAALAAAAEAAPLSWGVMGGISTDGTTWAEASIAKERWEGEKERWEGGKERGREGVWLSWERCGRGSGRSRVVDAPLWSPPKDDGTAVGLLYGPRIDGGLVCTMYPRRGRRGRPKARTTRFELPRRAKAILARLA